MKKIKTLFFLLISVSAFGQTYYQDIGDEDYQNLMKNGLSFVLTGDERSDEIFVQSLKDHWKVSPLKIVDKSEEGSLKDDDVRLMLLANEGSPFPFNLTIVSMKALKRKEMSLYKTTAVVDITGFTDVIDEKSVFYFVPYMVNALNDMAVKMNENKIEKRGLPYFNTMNALYLPNALALKTKTLLIVSEKKTLVNEAELTKAGIKYEFVNFDRFLELESTKADDYCLLYLNPSQFSEITIYNLNDKSIAYTRHYVKNVSKLDKEDIKLIVSSWK